jgi:hypothetical protein
MATKKREVGEKLENWEIRELGNDGASRTGSLCEPHG